jgi:hypothetical protein
MCSCCWSVLGTGGCTVCVVTNYCGQCGFKACGIHNPDAMEAHVKDAHGPKDPEWLRAQ